MPLEPSTPDSKSTTGATARAPSAAATTSSPPPRFYRAGALITMWLLHDVNDGDFLICMC